MPAPVDFKLHHYPIWSVLALRGGVWQTSSMKTSPNSPQCHEDRKAQKLLDRIDKKLQAKSSAQNLLQAEATRQSPQAA